MQVWEKERNSKWECMDPMHEPSLGRLTFCFFRYYASFHPMYCSVHIFLFYTSFSQLSWRGEEAYKVLDLGMSHFEGRGLYTACPLFLFLCNFQGLWEEAGMCCFGHWLSLYQQIQPEKVYLHNSLYFGTLRYSLGRATFHSCSKVVE